MKAVFVKSYGCWVLRVVAEGAVLYRMSDGTFNALRHAERFVSEADAQSAMQTR